MKNDNAEILHPQPKRSFLISNYRFANLMKATSTTKQIINGRHSFGRCRSLSRQSYRAFIIYQKTDIVMSEF